ncbi:hypothetical protein ACJ73_09888 [Blastomyces percursus]|uniref:Uncharacterized protein n=1 Tax=Blastomyces percursus TaxID=1658174 RepID=A0A1J9Q4X5_9EURO|nr:hypothetical protein ACJ73_09888 [Blastomyces percursus]
MQQWQNILTFWDLMGDVPEYRQLARDDFAEGAIQNTPTAKKKAFGGRCAGGGAGKDQNFGGTSGERKTSDTKNIGDPPRQHHQQQQQQQQQ